jgi:hypothetical protein
VLVNSFVPYFISCTLVFVLYLFRLHCEAALLQTCVFFLFVYSLAACILFPSFLWRKALSFLPLSQLRLRSDLTPNNKQTNLKFKHYILIFHRCIIRVQH